uniref:proline--tRNA ligase n=1 Tax=Angiostrongylus cantonensis TaxID=6313 RepID=A0A0K0DBI2_ANGCA
MVVFKASKYILNGCSPGTTKSNAHRLLLDHGFIHPVASGLYSLLPLGQRVIDKLIRLIDAELESIGALKVSLPILGSRVLWDKTLRWESMGSELFCIKDRHQVEYCLQPTAEEMCTHLISQLPNLKKRVFPLLLYQTTEKFRDEMNPRFGLLRAREFLMNDLYSFDLDKNSAVKTYSMVCDIYDRLFKDKLGLEVYKVSAKPGIHGGSDSHEYHLRNPLDEDGIHFCFKCGSGNKREDGPHDCQCPDPTSVSSFSTIEVAHTFQLGTNYSPLFLLEPKEGIRLPPIIAPFSAAVVVKRDLMLNSITDMMLSTLDRQLEGDVLFDDRVEDTIGKRIKGLQEIGIPRIVVIGKVTESTINEVVNNCCVIDASY